MDGTPVDELITELEQADPAEAADLADEIAARLATELETPDPEKSES